MRLRSDFWVSAYIRRCEVEGVVAVLMRRGAAEAGAIFIDVDHLDGQHTLYMPAPQTELDDPTERRWCRAHKSETIDSPALSARIAREASFDPDLWLVGVEDRQGRHFLDLSDQA